MKLILMEIGAIQIRLVKTVTAKPVNRFPTGNQCSEHVSPVIRFIAHRGDTT